MTQRKSVYSEQSNYCNYLGMFLLYYYRDLIKEVCPRPPTCMIIKPPGKVCIVNTWNILFEVSFLHSFIINAKHKCFNTCALTLVHVLCFERKPVPFNFDVPDHFQNGLSNIVECRYQQIPVKQTLFQ